MANAFRLEVVSPERIVLKEDVEFLLAPGVEGQLGILANHSPLMTALKIGVVTYRLGGKDEKLAISGGFLEVAGNKATILANTAEKEEEIDVERALAAKSRAEQRLSNPNSESDILRAEIALKRALARLQAAGKM